MIVLPNIHSISIYIPIIYINEKLLSNNDFTVRIIKCVINNRNALKIIISENIIM